MDCYITPASNSGDAPDIPGAVHSIISKISNAGIDIAYIYGYSSNGIAPLIIKVSDPEKADQIINKG